MLIISFKKVSIRNNSELFSISYLHCYFNIRYRNVYLTALIFNPMPLSEIPYFKAFPVVSFILLYWHGICGKFHIIRCIKFVHCFQKTDTSDLKEIFHIHTTSQKALCRAVDQSCIFMKQALSRLFIPLVRAPDQGKSVLRHLSLPANGLLHMNSSPLARL